MTRETAFIVQQTEMDLMGKARRLPFMGNRTRGRPMNPFPLTDLRINTVTLHAQPGGFGICQGCENRLG